MIDIHSGNPGKTIILTLFLVSVIMVFVSCNKVSTEETADVQDTAFSMGTAITSTLYGRNREDLEENLETVSYTHLEFRRRISELKCAVRFLQSDGDYYVYFETGFEEVLATVNPDGWCQSRCLE